ncbi:hypothetical protein BDY19DRAFT_902033 [Irpex rosettiformis]|uniref:Uncharacterized protein n=1 Tax=Irpex rosettiformis TaxID=378272 RepID=A0ACB8ULF2_9APHY|nr:hypothetical protein BDY19DRAFT_902033 [Irpex rosettiformis]
MPWVSIFKPPISVAIASTAACGQWKNNNRRVLALPSRIKCSNTQNGHKVYQDELNGCCLCVTYEHLTLFIIIEVSCVRYYMLPPPSISMSAPSRDSGNTLLKPGGFEFVYMQTGLPTPQPPPSANAGYLGFNMGLELRTLGEEWRFCIFYLGALWHARRRCTGAGDDANIFMETSVHHEDAQTFRLCWGESWLSVSTFVCFSMLEVEWQRMISTTPEPGIASRYGRILRLTTDEVDLSSPPPPPPPPGGGLDPYWLIGAVLVHALECRILCFSVLENTLHAG